MAMQTLAPGAAVKHPNLLLNRAEIEQIKRKIETQPWAARLFEKVKAAADDALSKGDWGDQGTHVREAALCYALTGEKRYADGVQRRLVGEARYALARYEKLDLKVQPEYGAWTAWGAYAWAYDLTYDTFPAEERQLVERWLHESCKIVIEGEKLWTTTPNLVFGKHFNVGLVGYCLGDKEFIEWGLNDPGAHGPRRGGIYPVLDSMINDGYFWGETPIYAIHYDVHGMLALAEAALHYNGTDLYRWVSKQSGASIKSLIDGYLRMGYPVERTGIGNGSIRMATYGDGSTSYSPAGSLWDTFLVNPVDPSPGVPVLSGELEIAYKRYKDPAYAWVLSLTPNRDTYIQYGRAVWGYIALTHGEPLPEKLTPPEAPGGIYPSQGFAFLRADESPEYWRSGAPAVLVMMGKLIGHGHNDYYNIILHGKGRLLYPDLNVIQYEPTYLNWTHEGISHNTLVVDHHSPRPGPFTTRHDFNEDVKFFAITGSAYPGVEQTRSLVLAKEYLADFFQAADTVDPVRTHVFDWALHGLGRLYPGNPAAYRETHALVPFYWWVDNERGRETDTTCQADWIQKSAGVTPGLQAFGKEWFDTEVGVRMTMLGAPGTHVYAGDGPICDGPPYHRIDGSPEGSAPMVVVRREGSSTLFAAVHEPYKGRPTIRQVQRLAETLPGYPRAQRVGDGGPSRAAAVAVQAAEFTDYVLAAFDPGEHTLASAEGEAFVFRDYSYLRVDKAGLRARGKLTAFRLRAQILPPNAGARVNGKPVRLRRAGEFLEWGDLPKQASGVRRQASGEGADVRRQASAREGSLLTPDASRLTPVLPDASRLTPAREKEAAERSAWLHSWFLPEEVHLAAGGEKEIEMHLRCVGEGRIAGRLRLIAPRGLTVTPAEVAVEPLSEGEERVVSFQVRSDRDATSALREIQVAPAGGLRAAPQTLLASTGVVITVDRSVPRSAQFIVRAPGYTMKVDQYSGVSYCLLDGDGHRRHGRIYNTNFITGFPGIERDGKWAFRFGLPCGFIWPGENNLVIGCAGTYGDHDVRLRYTFYDDRIAIGLIPPTNPTREQTAWLGNFDALKPPIHNGKQEAPNRPIVGDRFFFPHPVHRQGLLLTTPPDTPLSLQGNSVRFPLRGGQEATLRFLEEGGTGRR